jgi:hypothetical protein
MYKQVSFNPLNTELNPICHLLALLGAHLIFHVSRMRVKDVACTAPLLNEEEDKRSNVMVFGSMEGSVMEKLKENLRPYIAD